MDEFRKLLEGRYIFHLHTAYTDGASQVGDYCRWACENGCGGVVFTEHVRRRLSYDFGAFLSDIKAARRQFGKLSILAGIEAKVLPQGRLDIPEPTPPDIDVICFACHSFPADVELYAGSLRVLFSDSRWRDYARVWVHPGYFLSRLGLLDSNVDLLRRLIDYAVGQGVFIERNIRHHLPPESAIKGVPVQYIVTGQDAHSVEDIDKL